MPRSTVLPVRNLLRRPLLRLTTSLLPTRELLRRQLLLLTTNALPTRELLGRMMLRLTTDLLHGSELVVFLRRLLRHGGPAGVGLMRVRGVGTWVAHTR
ncbi:hypothetical protein [Kribbella sp. CA-293567]|uniref:hypothetical protein n=1 Tax=Kribbella sp. CA-293567 TaxID=3002436 RepID=UPI0022DD3FBC|nr:hypothetical protein [Kribbella sp. CA-293567]WBQ01997.1 hypothetical protein OX958_18590 [Kribbella sp. CA-293567]